MSFHAHFSPLLLFSPSLYRPHFSFSPFSSLLIYTIARFSFFIMASADLIDIRNAQEDELCFDAEKAYAYHFDIVDEGCCSACQGPIDVDNGELPARPCAAPNCPYSFCSDCIADNFDDVFETFLDRIYDVSNSVIDIDDRIDRRIASAMLIKKSEDGHAPPRAHDDDETLADSVYQKYQIDQSGSYADEHSDDFVDCIKDHMETYILQSRHIGWCPHCTISSTICPLCNSRSLRDGICIACSPSSPSSPSSGIKRKRDYEYDHTHDHNTNAYPRIKKEPSPLSSL